MRPIRLVISAFGPYKDEVIIDFTKLGENGIFLITGDTGSGKTTIFDAISFALFGEASGSRRENGSFRSDFALDDVKTFVELEFEHKGIVYKVERVPRYTRKKKRGDGVTSVGGDASLIYLDDIVTGEKNVTEKCVEILGMNSSQFKQISMIAQGEFLDLLLSKTKDRASIFRHIFDTGIYKNISDSLKNKYLLKKREYEDVGIATLGYIQGVQLNVELNGDESTEKVLELLNKEIDNDEELEIKLEEERNTLFKESTRIVEIISEGKIINESIVNLDKVKEELASLIRNEEEIIKKENIVKKNRSIWDMIIPKYNMVCNLEKELDEKRELLEFNKVELANILKKYDACLVEYNGIEDKFNKTQECNKRIEQLEKELILYDEIESLERELVDVNRNIEYCKLMSKIVVLDKCKVFREEQLEVDKLRDKIIKCKDEYVKSNEIYGNHYDLFLSAQAGILAKDLKEGHECPVCGSKDHPRLAKVVDEVLSKEELDKERSLLEVKYQELEELRLELVKRENELDILKSEIIEVNEDELRKEIESLQDRCVGIVCDISKEAEFENRSQQISLLLDEKKRNLSNDFSKKDVDEEITNYKNLIVVLEDDIKRIRNDYEILLNKRANLESVVKVLGEDIVKLEKKCMMSKEEYVISYQQLGYKDEEDYLKIKIDKEELLELEREVNKYREEVLRVKSNMSSLEKVINGRKMVDLNIYEEQLKEVNEKLDNINLSLKDINSKLSNNKKIYSNLKDVSERTTKLEQEVMIYKDLSDTANGSITGKSKLEFEQYVQASYFDRVLVSANKRFGYMTGDRYQLLRKEEALKVSDKLGLELEVMDYYTGKRRDVKSLSGGESFKAALSLALGMSDTIQEFSGGVVVEAMFIDEGFGSLDDESLEQAMNAIMALSQSNKMIGIISHVNELKNRIDKKIVVKKSSSGSSVSLVV